MEKITLSVSDCIALVNQTLEFAYPSVVVEGEVSSFKISKDKYVFFDLKDEQGVLGCFMMIYGLRMPIEDGMKVKVIAQPRLTAWGKFSLNVREVTLSGEGDLKRSFELLKAKLTTEGLFDEARKRRLPHLPTRIGLISSVQAAGYKDFVTILGARWGGIEITVADVQVQGAAAADQIMNAIRHFNEEAEPPEVLVIVRGGGSAEDLAVFNEEPLVRAIASSRVPTLVGVGHEVDTSLSDLAADVRAATPTNAAQLLVPDRREILAQVAHSREIIMDTLERRKHTISNAVDVVRQQVFSHVQQRQKELAKHLQLTQTILKQLNPKTVLNRGYALVRDAQGKIARGAGVKIGDTLDIELESAIIKAGVTNVQAK